MSDGEFYYCLVHHAVEPYDGCKNDDRLGPYASREDAQHALETVQQRNEAWENDPRWNDEDEREARDEADQPGTPFGA